MGIISISLFTSSKQSGNEDGLASIFSLFPSNNFELIVDTFPEETLEEDLDDCNGNLDCNDGEVCNSVTGQCEDENLIIDTEVDECFSVGETCGDVIDTRETCKLNTADPLNLEDNLVLEERYYTCVENSLGILKCDGPRKWVEMTSINCYEYGIDDCTTWGCSSSKNECVIKGKKNDGDSCTTADGIAGACTGNVCELELAVVDVY